MMITQYSAIISTNNPYPSTQLNPSSFTVPYQHQVIPYPSTPTYLKLIRMSSYRPFISLHLHMEIYPSNSIILISKLFKFKLLYSNTIVLNPLGLF